MRPLRNPPLTQAEQVLMVRLKLWLLSTLAVAGVFGSPDVAQTGDARQSVNTEGATLQIDFAEGQLDLPRSEIVQRIQMAAMRLRFTMAVSRYCAQEFW